MRCFYCPILWFPALGFKNINFYMPVVCVWQRAVVLSDRAAEIEANGESAEPPEHHSRAAAASDRT